MYPGSIPPRRATSKLLGAPMLDSGRASSRMTSFDSSRARLNAASQLGAIVRIQVSPRRFYALVLARFSPGRPGKRMALVYVFGPMKGVARPIAITNEMAADAVWIAQVQDCDIANGKWAALGRVDGFAISKWPIPVFFTIDDELGHYTATQMDDRLGYKRIIRISPKDVIEDRELIASGAGSFVGHLIDRHNNGRFPMYPDVRKVLRARP